MPRKGGKRKKARTHVEDTVEGGAVGADVPKSDVPRSIVAKANKVSPLVGTLVKDLRKLMGPYTATHLKERSYNRVKDYCAVASQLGISHILAVSETKQNIVLRVARFQNGPTLHFRVPQYSLTKQVRSLQRRPFDSTSAYLTPPLVVLNNFSQAEESHLQLMRVTLQHMFPSINVNTVRLNECRRVVLFHYIKENSLVEMRHYAIRAAPVGISRSIKKVVHAKIPNLGNLKDISEFIEGASGAAGGMSDSEAEDDPSTRVELPERYVGRGNGQSQQSAMRLMELGPRVTLELFKVEKGLCEGDVLYHKFEEKTPEEAAKIKAKVESMKNLKEQRRAQQEENVRKKRDLAELKRTEKEERKKRRLEGGGSTDDRDEGSDDSEREEEEEEEGEYDNEEMEGNAEQDDDGDDDEEEDDDDDDDQY